jgi:hypothetical protein
MQLDCTDYSDDKKCPKKLQIIKEKSNSNSLNVIMTGCWGVYCWDGEQTLLKYNPPPDTKDENHPFFIEDKGKIYGSKRVVNGMIKYTNIVDTACVFLAGDNVYGYNIPKDKLVELVNKGTPPDKKMYKLDNSISSQEIDIQLQTGFLDCFNNVKVEDFYVAVGNHDVATCYDLNRQLEFATNPNNKYRLPGVYYNVVYKMKDYNVNFIVIDTNIFEEEPVSCSGKKYDKQVATKLINTQVEWVLDTLKKEKCTWNIIIGHIPYKSNPHKQKKDKPNFILNTNLDYLFTKIKEQNSSFPKVQAYFCADEHNQQFLYDKSNNMSLIVAGSGGTVLDKKIIKGKYWDGGDEVSTLFYSNNFGFVSFSFGSTLKIKYFECISLEKTKSIFEKIVDINGNLK